jgi:hypothetical protein
MEVRKYLGVRGRKLEKAGKYVQGDSNMTGTIFV